MAAPNFSADDFVSAMQRLLPRGHVWPRDPDSNLYKLLLGLALICEAQTGRANYLLEDAFPRSTTELLSEWEATLGLPDPCLGPLPTLEQRRDGVVQKLTALGGQSVAYFIDMAAKLGYTVTITEFAPWTVGLPLGPIYGTAWAYAWRINAPEETVEPFRVTSGVGEPLAAWGNELLECVMNDLKPAHTILQFAYGV